MLFIILLIVITLYVIEVALGSSATVYNCEIGYDSCCEEPKKLSHKQFFRTYSNLRWRTWYSIIIDLPFITDFHEDLSITSCYVTKDSLFHL